MTAADIPGYHCIEALGLVEGNATVAKHVGRDLLAGFRNLVGCEIVKYTQLLADARAHVMERMLCVAPHRDLIAYAVSAARLQQNQPGAT